MLRAQSGSEALTGNATGVCAGTASTIAGWRCAQYDGIVAMAAGEHFGRGRGVNSMMVALLIAGIGFLLAGLSAIGFGIPIKEFSLGNTLIIAGTVAACTGMLLLGLWIAVEELKTIARRLGLGRRDRARARTAAATGGGKPARGAAIRPAGTASLRAMPNRRRRPAPSPPWHEEAAPRDRAPDDAPAAPRRRSRAGRQAAAQPVVFLVIPQGTRARPGANAPIPP